MLPLCKPAPQTAFAPYRLEQINKCPGCERSQWLIGGVTAECVFCATALELPRSTKSASAVKRREGRGPWVG